MGKSNSEGRVPEPPASRLRCAIYTRKSTEEGLDQEFNSLDAQREAAEAFIQSQRREGWIALPELYADGGFTGANMDRPALGRLFQAIEAGELDCVVVYKVDRLSRSLLDFTRMLSVFEKHQVSFVAVTQQFNTSTSLGRLTLNILLSFAQFEGELIGERTRDKMSAARRKGKWVGGCPVLGYDVDPGGGRLVVNEEEAERVRAIFALFEEHGSALRTLTEIDRRGWRLKSWTLKTGELRTGGPFALNSLRRLLTNILYTGAIRHKGQPYPGEHAAILAPGTWERVQKPDCSSCVLCARQIAEHTSGAAQWPALLRHLRDPDAVLVFGEERSQVPLLCLSERAAQGLGGVSRQVAIRARHRGVGPGADQRGAARSFGSRRVATNGPGQAGRGDPSHRETDRL